MRKLDKYWFFTYIVEIIKNLLFTAAVFVYSKNPNKTNIKPGLTKSGFHVINTNSN